MSADELRRAAATVRENAGAAPDGPWKASGPSVLGTPQGCHKRDCAQLHEEVILGYESPELARHVATMHPGVGLVLADLLEEFAKAAQHLDDYDGFDPFVTIDGYGHALTIARLVNGCAS